jgi:hypothetical protein
MYADCPLAGTALGELKDLLCTVFDAAGLEMHVRVTLGDGLYNAYAAKTDPLEVVAFRLLEGLQRHGTTALFLQSVVQARPHRPDVGACIVKWCPQSQQPPPQTKTLVDGVIEGVQEVRRRVGNPAVRGRIDGSRDHLRRMTGEIELLAGYKTLHDVLHKIQLKHYRFLSGVLRDLRSRPDAPDLLDGYTAEMRTFATDARAAAVALPAVANIQAQELAWVEELDKVVIDLRALGPNDDERTAFDPIRRLKRILRLEPFRVNRLLALTAQNLPLAPLIDTLKDIADAVARVDATEDRIQSGLNSLRRLEPRLLGRVTEHRLWQEIENDLWLAEETLSQGSHDSWEEFRLLWERIKQQIGALSALEPDATWVKGLARHVATCDAACESTGPPADLVNLRRTFGRYRLDALHQFYQVDLDLKSSCGEIVAIGRPLSDLLADVNHGPD